MVTSTPIITDSTTAGAEITAPQDMPREIRNSSAVNDARLGVEAALEILVGGEQRALWKNGTNVTDRMIIAIGSA